LRTLSRTFVSYLARELFKHIELIGITFFGGDPIGGLTSKVTGLFLIIGDMVYYPGIMLRNGFLFLFVTSLPVFSSITTLIGSL